jgi:hypothetical protein
VSPKRTSQLTHRRRAIFACFMGGFLIAQFIPVEFTSILSATVWSFSGRVYALVFVIAGTFFRADSITILAGIANIVSRLSPSELVSGSTYVAIAVMFVGNLAATFLFKALIRRAIFSHIPAVLFAG